MTSSWLITRAPRSEKRLTHVRMMRLTASRFSRFQLSRQVRAGAGAKGERESDICIGIMIDETLVLGGAQAQT